MFYWDWLNSMGFRDAYIYYILATVIFQVITFQLFKDENLDESDIAALGMFCLFILHIAGFISVWAMPLIVPTGLAFGIHKLIDLFVTGKYEIRRKE